jgi:hypothetical protein
MMHQIKSVSLSCVFLILISLISCSDTELQNQNPIPVDPTMPTDTAKPTDSDMEDNGTSSPEETPDREKKDPDPTGEKAKGDKQGIRELGCLLCEYHHRFDLLYF